MSHTISGYIAKYDELEKVFPRREVTLLPQGFGFVVGGPYVVGDLEKERDQAKKIPKVAYVETDFFGGFGTQTAIVWDQGLVYMEDYGSTDGAINDALRFLGVVTEGSDEFDALTLGRYRSNEDFGLNYDI